MSNKTTCLLDRGAKFDVELTLDNADKVALVLLVADKPPEDQKALILSEVVDYLTGHRDKTTSKQGFGAGVREQEENNIKLWVYKKQGAFGVLDAESYRERAVEAIGKNFVPIHPVKLKEAKQDIVSLLTKEYLDRLFGKVK